LEQALRLVSRNGGSAGVDGIRLEQINREDSREQWLAELELALRTRTYRPDAVLRVYIPKGDGQRRPLGIPTVKDRVVQAAAMIVLLPIFEADMHERSYGYRPGRNAQQAVLAIIKAIADGRHEVIDADLSGYFDSIPHQRLMKLVAGRVSDGTMLKLIREWLRAPIEERDEQGRTRRKRSDKGTPQGGVISPLLANLYLSRLDHEVNDQCRRKPVMVRYADDFVILCRQGEGQELLTRLNRWLQNRGLKLNRDKTRLINSRNESFKFLGYSVSQRWRKLRRIRYVHVEPHAKSQQKLRNAIKERINHWTEVRNEEQTIRELNRVLKGWAGYFRFRNYTRVFSKMQFYASMKVGRWLWRRHGKKTRYQYQGLVDTYGLYRLI
jgi:group II intron reverse transcriptase/maturase